MPPPCRSCPSTTRVAPTARCSSRIGRWRGHAALGVALGLVGAVAVTRFLSSLLYDVSPTDPAVLAASAALLTVVAAAASWGPTRRTASIDPVAALKAE